MTEQSINPTRQWPAWVIWTLLGIALRIGVPLEQNNSVTVLPYSEFRHDLASRQVPDVPLAGSSIQGTLKEALPQGGRQFITERVEPDLAEDLDKYASSIGTR